MSGDPFKYIAQLEADLMKSRDACGKALDERDAAVRARDERALSSQLRGEKIRRLEIALRAVAQEALEVMGKLTKPGTPESLACSALVAHALTPLEEKYDEEKRPELIEELREQVRKMQSRFDQIVALIQAPCS